MFSAISSALQMLIHLTASIIIVPISLIGMIIAPWSEAAHERCMGLEPPSLQSGDGFTPIREISDDFIICELTIIIEGLLIVGLIVFGTYWACYLLKAPSIAGARIAKEFIEDAASRTAGCLQQLGAMVTKHFGTSQSSGSSLQDFEKRATEFEEIKQRIQVLE